MTAGVVAGPTLSAVGQLNSAGLTITVRRPRAGEVSSLGAADTCSAHDAAELVDRVLTARAVRVERRLDEAATRLRPRAARESAVTWLSRVLVAVLAQLEDPDVACALVATAIRRTAGVPVSIECWPTDEFDATVSETHAWPAWRGEVPIVRSARGVWTLVCPNGSVGIEGEYAGLLAAMTRCVCESDADRARAREAIWPELAGAVAALEPSAFVAAAARFLGGAVSLRDAAGEVVARAGGASAAIHEIELRDESGFRGTLALAAMRDEAEAIGLPELSLALLRSWAAFRDVDVLENRLAVLTCFVDSDLDEPRVAAPVRGRRIVVINADPGRLGVRELGRLHRAARAVPLLVGLSLVLHDGGALGAYSDDSDSGGEAHRVAWEQLLRDVCADESTRIVVGARCRDADASKEQRATLECISRIQCDGAGYFDLPRVAVLDQVGPLSGVLTAMPGQQVVPYVQRVLGDLIADPRFGGQLIDTLYAYLQSGGSPRSAGELLHLHGSSVKYRMRVLRELLGERLDDPSKRFDIELALRLHLAGRELAAGLAR